MRIFLKTLVLVGLAFLGNSFPILAQYHFSEKPLKQVLEELNRESEYILLYRESLIKGVVITLSSAEEHIFDVLKEELLKQNLNMLLDEAQKQIVIYRISDPTPRSQLFLKGYIVDDRSGERLPFATLSWQIDEDVTGVAANQAGYYTAQISTQKESISLKVSYLGYKEKILEFSVDEIRSIGELTIRLTPTVTNAKEVIVTGLSGNSAVQKTVDINRGTVLGESNTYKSLQQLPSVTIGPALSEGLHVRGSPSDGFNVLLDEVTIYNQSHLFGLFDNFNADAIRTSGLYYGVTPASYQAPLGGTLALITRTGSVNEYKGGFGFSNTSLNGTIEGPISKGKASFLFSGRTSFIDHLNWFGNNELINWGLDVARPSKFLNDDNVSLSNDIVRTVGSNAFFGDLHGKLNLETTSGTRFMLSGYFGFDDISVDAERLFRSFNSGQGIQVDYEPVQSTNLWNNGKVSGHIQRSLSQNLFSNSTIGWSVFDTHFSKDDFTYTQINPGTGSLESFTSKILIKSIINELIIQEDLEWVKETTRINAGISYQYFIGEYFEDSFERPLFFKKNRAHKVDGWLQSELTLSNSLLLKGGVRTHYYSEGKHVHFSPRISTTLFPNSPLKVGGGFSRNYQYMNRISFSNVLSSDVWVLVDEQQQPSYVDHVTAGIYYDKKDFSAQLEGYFKFYKYLRLHEIETYSITNAFNATPWFSNNTGEGNGVEFIIINKHRLFEINQTLTLSKMELQNPEVNEGKAFLSDWNRTWQYSGVVKINWFKGFNSTITQIYATGTPNKLDLFGFQGREELGDYFRTDLRFSYSKSLKNIEVNASISLYNLFDVQNPWYREFGFGLQTESGSQRFISVPIEIYDLGFQPSFSVSLKFI